MPKVAIFLIVILMNSLFVHHSFAYLGGDLLSQNYFDPDIQNPMTSNILDIPSINSQKTESVKRYLVFGPGISDDVDAITNQIYSVNADSGFFLVGILEQNKANNLKAQGYTVMPDFLLDLHSTNDDH